MTAKQYLRRVAVAQTKITNLQKEYKDLISKSLPSGISYDSVKVQTSPDDKMVNLMIEGMEISSRINAVQCELMRIRNEVVSAIHNLDDGRYISLLYKRYVDMDSFEKIAVDSSYSFDYVLKLHGQALAAFTKANNDIL